MANWRTRSVNVLWLCLCAGLSACAGSRGRETVGGRASALSEIVGTTDDTFINSLHPDNNNGASLSIFTGVDGQGGVMRGLIRFAMPSMTAGRVTVREVTLTMTLEALGNGSSGNGGVQSLQAVSEAWVQGNAIGSGQQEYVVGQTCSATISGATWNQPDCMSAPGTGAAWTTPGATVAASVSGTVDTTGLDVNVPVVWDSAATGNAGMVADVQGWIDNPGSNQGWRIASDNETSKSAQRFFSTEAGGSTVPVLGITYVCKVGFVATAAGDGGGPTCVDQNECLPNHCRDSGDSAATCTDHVAPATGYDCACSAGFAFNGFSCVGSCGGAVDPCGHGGACTSSAGAWTCACPTGYVSSGGNQPSCVDRNDCVPNHCGDNGDLGAGCVDHAAPATGYDCACDTGFGFDGVTCTRPDAGPGDAAADEVAPIDAANATDARPVTDGASGADHVDAPPADGGKDGAADGSATSTSSGGGCSCAIVAGDPAGSSAAFAVAAGLCGAWLRRSRRRRA